ncbi:hypothetical protein CEUSTIGMA_g5522.t1 [Chlamydomonas eustigma]|uniref:GH18 domain-containing protein n=1 Tax=Chlamydomonas eustigma TaxID=1157962 RepID=A0A250X5Q1_9CHLO|nr:hypothetical protein CEUSTIGMA_g5522.t1 [Chlamydomonas eustigma]|eukprot:GAX78080.1 hypothetical protein CEUSTIGMA_g5522.t1 [Chlamydomonas eustigma]
MLILAFACLLYLVSLTHSIASNTVSLSQIQASFEGEDIKRHCPCASKSLCKPVQRHVDREVFGFLPPNPRKSWESFDFSQLSTIAWTTDPALMCYAHSMGARVTADGRQGLAEVLTDASKRSQWVFDAVQQAESLHLDGINFDFEDPTEPGSSLALGYSLTVKHAAEVFHRHIPGSQVSVDVPWSPYDVDGRNYDWAGLAAAADLLFVMSYDMQSQIYGRCIAAANSPAALVEKGLRQWLDLGVPRSKIVLGLPWYGYDYECQPDSTGRPMQPSDTVCHLAHVPFQGAPCSDAAGSQKGYLEIMEILRSGRNTTHMQMDSTEMSPFFNYEAKDGSIHQIWFDNPESLSVKYQMASDLNLRGVGIWNLDTLDYESSDPVIHHQTSEMWEALKIFSGRS